MLRLTERALGHRLRHALAHAVERLARLGGRVVQALKREVLGRAHRVARVVAVRGGDVEDHAALDPQQRDDVRRRGDRAADAERAALEPREAHVLLERHPRELLRRVSRARDPHPLGGLRPEALGRRQRDVLGRAVGLREHAVPEPLRRALELLDLGGGLHAAWRLACGGMGILDDDMKDDREQLIELLTRGVLDGDRDGDELHRELDQPGRRARAGDHRVAPAGHPGGARATRAEYGARIKELYGVVPGSLDFKAEQSYLQPPDEQTDIVHVIKGVIEAESGAIEHYNRIIEFCEGRDPVTQDMVITILRDEEGHRRLFEGFLREYKAEGLA